MFTLLLKVLTISFSDPALWLQFWHTIQWIPAAILGVATKLAFELRTKALTKGRVITSTIMAMFVGYGCDVLCTKFGYEDTRGFIISIGALLSESIIQWLLAKETIQALIKKFTGFSADKNAEKDSDKKDV